MASSTYRSGQVASQPANDPDRLFDGDDTLFKSLFADCSTYAEYGCGASTLWVLRNSAAQVMAVDTSREWIERVAKDAHQAERLAMHWVDVGPLLNWGRPRNYAQRRAFNAYTDWIWRQAASPEVVLVDGRFRVCCFLTSFKHAAPGTRIVFDDYCDREHYHVVEEFLAPAQTCGRQALFIRPDTIGCDPRLLDVTIEQFRMVLE